MASGVRVAAVVCAGLLGALPAAATANVYSQQGAVVSPGDEFPASAFGSVVAVSADGNTALVGGPDDAAGLGAAWVYTRTGSSWSEQAKLAPPVGGTSGAAGTAVALSADGTTAFVGAPLVNPGGSPRGAVFVYSRSGSSWQSTQQLVPSDEGTSGSFGTRLALSSDGSTLLVSGAANGSAVVWVYTSSGDSWQEVQQIAAPSDAVGGGLAAAFGTAVAVSGDGSTLLIGGYTDGNKGAVWVFTRAQGSWSEAAKIGPPADAVQGALPLDFGETVAISQDGSTALIGAPGDSATLPSNGGNSGAAWVYIESGGGWVEQQKLTASTYGFGRGLALSADGTLAFVSSGNLGPGTVVAFVRSGSVWAASQQFAATDTRGQSVFGGALALAGSGTTLVVGDELVEGAVTPDARGEAWVYTLAASSWSEQQALGPPADEQPWSQFGATVAVSTDGSTAIVGGPTDNDAQGAAWIYARSGSSWSEQQELVPPISGTAGEEDEVGADVAISGDGQTAVIGSYAGAAWVYTRSGSSWSLAQELSAPTDSSGISSGFGQSVALSADGQTLLIGGPDDRDGTNSTLGAAWVYVLTGGNWVEQQNLTVPADATAAIPAFGVAVALSADGSTALIGSRNPGAWVYARSGSSWSEQQELAPPADLIGSTSGFGSVIALNGSGTLALLGDEGLDSSGAGAAWAYGLSGGHWSELAKIAAPADESGPGHFGSALALSSDGTQALIAGPYDGDDVGAVWVYGSGNGGASWTEQQKLPIAGSGSIPNVLAVGLSGDASTALVGAPIADGEIGTLTVFGAVAATVPGPPVIGSASAGDRTATVSFAPPGTDGGSEIVHYTVTATDLTDAGRGGESDAGSASPITVSGLTNGDVYTFTVTATNNAGTGPASGSSVAVTPSVSSGAGGVSHGGGGGGSDFISVSLSPGSQTVAAGGTASWSVTVTNTGGNYVGDVAVGDGSVPGCSQTSGQSAGLYSMAPGVSVSYSCSAGVSGDMTNSVSASAVGPAGDTVTASASATVTVTGSAVVLPPVVKMSSNAPKVTQTVPTVATLTLGPLKALLLDTAKPSVRLSAELSKGSVLAVLLLDGKGKTVARWSYQAKAGSNTITLLLPKDARKAGHDRLTVSQTGAKKPLTEPITLRI